MKEKYTPCGEEDIKEYIKPDNTHYSEKTSHKARTIAHDQRPNGHRSFFRKKNIEQ